jgi:glucans biosynthesis protein C
MENRPAPDPAPARLHALDNLRALLMWLGIVLHVSAIHMLQNAPLAWRDEARSRGADILVAFIHTFRMPAFFIIAGFFVALLLQSRGPAGMARHRAMRLGLPFAVLWLPVAAATGVFALLFMHRIARGTWGLDPALLPASPTGEKGANTMHLWFVWLLFLFCMVTAAVARWIPATAFDRPARWLQRAGLAAWGPLVLALPLVVPGLGYAHGVVAPSGRFLPPAAEWLHNGMFFVFGLALYHQQWDLFSHYRRRWGAYAAAGVLPFLATGALVERDGHAALIAYVYNVAAWAWSFAAIGLALKVLDKRHAALAYLADSSYWVYLVHMPLTVGFGALLYGLPLPVAAKMAINIAATTLVCVATYHVFVRFTWVSVLLNGRRHARAPRPSSGVAHASP